MRGKEECLVRISIISNESPVMLVMSIHNHHWNEQNTSDPLEDISISRFGTMLPIIFYPSLNPKHQIRPSEPPLLTAYSTFRRFY